MINEETIKNQTKTWISSVIVKHNICPFAGREVARDSIRYSVFFEDDEAVLLENLLNECRILDMDNDVETSLLIFPRLFTLFEHYLDFVDMANELLDNEDYKGVYQLATFHPDYLFESSAIDDPSNYTNRSPYPMIHIIRESSLERVLRSYTDPESIPLNNIELTRKLGLNQMVSMLQACFNSDTEKD